MNEKKQYNPEVRTFTEFKRMEGEENRTLEGYAAVFNKRSEMLWDWGQPFYEVIERGAFSDVLGDDVRALLNHDPNHLLARTKSGTLTLEQDDNGLKFRFDIPKSRDDVLEMVERGDLDQNSFAFYIEEDEWKNEEGLDVRYIKKVRELRDITLATYPAYKDTSVSLAQRSYEQWQEEIKRESTEEVESYEVEAENRERALTLHAHIIN